MTTDSLKKHITDLPSGPGVYIFKANTRLNLVLNRNLYIGKAANLKVRLCSYLKTVDPRIKKMIELAKSLEFISTQSDIEALVLESQLIKKLRPRFNIVMRDDKQYAFIGFTAEKFPKIFITHQPTKNQNFIGPFTEVGALKITLRYLRGVFPYCTCRQLHHNRCLNYHIGKCLGFCCLKQQKPDPQGSTLKKSRGRTLNSYRKNILAIKDILNGKKVSLIKNLEKEMNQLAKNGNLEKAIELRNKISNLKRIFENARIIKNSDIIKTHRSGLESLLKLSKPIIRIEGYDVSNIQGIHATGSMVTFVHGQPDKNFYRKFKIYIKQTPDDTAMLKEILERRFRHNEWPFPDLIVIDGGKGQVNAARAAISNYQGSTLNLQEGRTLKTQKIPIIGISKNERHIGHQLVIPGRKSASANSGGWRIVPLTKLSGTDRNLLLEIDSEAHRFAIGYYRKLHRKSLR